MNPILKEGDHEMPANNRPLSLLAVASKVLERWGEGGGGGGRKAGKEFEEKGGGGEGLSIKYHQLPSNPIHNGQSLLSKLNKLK